MTNDNNEIPVVVAPEAKEEAYRMGYERFTHEPNEPLDDHWFGHYTESVEWANSKLPTLRAMAGAADAGHATYTEHRDIVTVEYPENRPMSGTETNSRYVFDELVDMFRSGAYDKIHGNEYGETLEY